MSTYTKAIFTGLLFSCLLLCTSSAKATHIVGGELEVEHLQDSTYMLRAILYFDKFYGSTNAKDNEITVHIFDKATDALIETYVIDLIEEAPVNYSDPDCSVATLDTDRFLYERTVTLRPSIYNEPEGYYLVWERCCRNRVIDNIERPDTAGMVFYLEFPPVVKDGSEFINSTPSIFPPLSDFACKGLPYFVDFRGVDKDGDSLVYSLSHPLNGNATVPNPRPTTAIPAPYSEVTFKPNYSADNQVLGNPPLTIDQAGFLRVTPDSTGLFVFAIKCEEYRDGVKIGEVRRDFQLLVLDCPEYVYPEITAVDFTPDSAYNQSDTITYLYTEDSPCLNITVKDFEANSAITAELRPLNFSLDDVSLSPTAGTLSGPGDSLQLQLCLPDCPISTAGGVLAFEVIVKDNSCALPLMDTATFYVDVVPVPNDAPALDLTIPFDSDSGYYFTEIELGNTLNFDVSALDIDGDSLALQLIDAAAITAQLAAIGNFNFAASQGIGNTSSQFTWTPTNCAPLPKDTTEWFFPMQFTVTDLHQCQEFDEPDTVDVLIRLFYHPPNVVTTLDVSPIQFETSSNTFFVELATNELLTLDVVGEAQDALVALSAIPNGFNFADLGMQFTPIQGNDRAFTQFSWLPNCERLLGAQSGTYEVAFVVNSTDVCTNLTNTDTLTVEIRLTYVPQPNEIPQVSTSLSDADTITCDTLYLGEQINFDVLANDIDGHFISLIGRGRGFDLADYGIQFNDLSGFGQLSQGFSFDVSCDPNSYPNPSLAQEELLVDFIVQDSSDCFIMTTDTISVKLLLIKDFSPNNTPSITADIANFDAATRTYTVDALVGETVTFTVTGLDADLLEEITLSASGNGFNLEDVNMNFPTTTGISPLTATFSWQIDCDYLNTGFTPASYSITLLVEDATKNCGVSNLNSATVVFNISDIPQPIFAPANAFSPNGDGIGDEYFISSLPLNDCTDTFIGIKIYNRWGKLVFESKDRNFRWDGLNVPAGIYFYEISYQNSIYKGTVHALKK